MMNALFGMKVFSSPHVQPVPVITFDPQRKCTWASEAYRAEVNAWLLERFGTMEIAYMLNPRALGMLGGQMIIMNPQQIAMLKMHTV